MNFEKRFLNELLESGRLVANGDLLLDEEMVFDHVGEETGTDPGPVVTDFGFYGSLDLLGCRPNVHAEAVVDEFRNSPNPSHRAAAMVAPKSFCFKDEFWDNQAGSLQNDVVYDFNHNYWLMARELKPLMNVDKTPVEGKWFFSLGNDNYPHSGRLERRDRIIEAIQAFMRFWLIDKAASLGRTHQLGDPRP